MIITCTLNPAIDYHLYRDHFDKGKLNRVEDYHYELGGKGINVSKSLNQLACYSRSITLLNPKLKVLYKKTLENSPFIKFDIVKIKALTRLNVKLHGRLETEVNTSLEKVTGCEIHKLRQKILRIKSNDVLVFSGSTIKDELYLYDSLLASIKNKEIHTIIDIPAELYNQVLKYKPLLVKPNKDELKSYFELKEDPESYVPYCKELITKGAQNVVVSLGEKGSILVTKDKSYQIVLESVKTNSTVGAGDAFVAGFAYYYQKTQDIVKSYQFAHATSYALIIHTNFHLKDVEDIFENIELKEI